MNKKINVPGDLVGMTSVFEMNSEVLKCTFVSLRNVHGCSSCYELPALQDQIVENTEK